jgi:hypothetical protein
VTHSTPTMIKASSTVRGLALLVLAFGVGGVSGVAVDRTWLRPRVEVAAGGGYEAKRPPGGRRPETIDADQIPTPLEGLQLSPQEEEQLHAIARRWRPQAARAVEGIRANISELENNMFAEMLCVLSKEKQDRYLAQLQENGANRVLIDKRFALVRSNKCEDIRRGGEPRR